MSDADEPTPNPSPADRARALASRFGARATNMPVVRTVIATLETYDRAGGGLVAGGLAYAALIAILPGLLLVISIAGLLISDPALRATLVRAIAAAVPPLEETARTALDQVSAGAGPTSIFALAVLAFGASRFHAALDEAFARIFHNAPVRNVVERYLRAFVSTALLVVIPAAVIIAGVIVAGILEVTPLNGAPEALRPAWGVGVRVVTVLLFILGVATVYRLVPARHVPLSALGLPAVVGGLLIGGFTQLFALLAPWLLGTAALYGAFVAVFALLAWLSISLNVLLLGAAWTRVRLLAASDPDAPAAEAEPAADVEPGED